MKRAFAATLLILSIVSPAMGQVVMPQDGMAFPRIIGIPNIASPSVYSRIDVTGLAPGDTVRVTFTPACTMLNMCPGTVLAAIANPAGNARIDVTLGGCCRAGGAPVTHIRVNGVIIRQYPIVVSPDWNGAAADRFVSLVDLSFFGACWIGGGRCCSYVGTGGPGLADLVVFGSTYGDNC